MLSSLKQSSSIHKKLPAEPQLSGLKLPRALCSRKRRESKFAIRGTKLNKTKVQQ